MSDMQSTTFVFCLIIKIANVFCSYIRQKWVKGTAVDGSLTITNEIESNDTTEQRQVDTLPASLPLSSEISANKLIDALILSYDFSAEQSIITSIGSPDVSVSTSVAIKTLSAFSTDQVIPSRPLAKYRYDIVLLHTDNSKVEQLLRRPKPKDYRNYPEFCRVFDQCRQQEGGFHIDVIRVRGHTTRFEQEQCWTKHEFAKVDQLVRQKLQQHTRHPILVDAVQMIFKS